MSVTRVASLLNTTATTVVNKKIVFSDTILPVKDFGRTIKVSSVSGVNESSLCVCLQKILESNPNVIFNIIQYSKNQKKVYFYTNKEISIEAWKNSKIVKYKPMTLSSEILNEIKGILNSKENKDDNCICLYDVSNLMKDNNYKYEIMKNSYEKQLKSISKQKFGNLSGILIYDFNYEKNELKIDFNKYWEDNNLIIFGKINGDLYVKESESRWSREVLINFGNELSKLYDEFIKYSKYKKQHCYNIKCINSNFLIDVSKDEVGVFLKNQNEELEKDLILASDNYKNGYKYNCNSNTVTSIIAGKEDEIFKKIFIKIEDCPEWSKSVLYEIRKNQLLNEEPQKQEQKKIELKKKIFSFFK